MHVAAAIPAVAILAGSGAGLLVPDIPRSIPLVTMVAACATAVVVRRRDRALIACVIVGFGAGGQALASDAWTRARSSTLRNAFDDAEAVERATAAVEHRFVPEDGSVSAVVDGVLRADAAQLNSGVSLSIDVTRLAPRAIPGAVADVSGGAIVTIAGSLAADRIGEWRAGRRVRLPATLHRPTRYLDAGVPDGERALLLRGTVLVGTAKSGSLVDVVAHAGWIDERLADVRAFSRRTIREAVGTWSGRAAAIVTAIVIGDRAGLDDSVQQSLQQAGTYHVIAISGGNIAILAGLMLGMFRLAGVLGRTASLVAMAVLLIYGALVGGGASVNRATLMAMAYFGARAADQRSPPLNTLALVAVLLVAVQPFSVVDPAFILTFGATLAILVVAPSIPAAIPRRLLPVVSLFVASAATEAALFPAGALFFSRVTFAGLALNFLAIPLMAVAQIAGMAIVPLAWLWRPLAGVAGFVAYLGAEGLVRSAELVRFVPLLAFRVAPPSWWVVVVYYVALAVSWRTRRLAPMLAAGTAATWMLAEPWSWIASRGDGRIHVSFLDVGQGDSAFVRLPRGTTLLVDTGGLAGMSSFDIGDRVVAPVLRHAGVRRLDYLVLTHGDPDHVGGAAAVIDEFRPRQVWEGIPVPRFEPLKMLKAAAVDRGLSWTSVVAGDHLRLDEVDIRVLHPPPADWERQRVRNDDSIVLELRWRDVSFVFTGDIGAAVERALQLQTAPAPIRIVKVPHHGSLTSSTSGFVEALHPQVAVFSVGRSNHFGHPAPAVLDRYRQAGAAILRTDQNGEIDIVTDGQSITSTVFLHEGTKEDTKDTKHDS
jgi:competence protein ComEC